MERRGLEAESPDSWAVLADDAPTDRRDDLVTDDVVIDLRDGATLLDLRALDGPRLDPVEAPLPELAPLVEDPNRVPLVGSRWVLLVALALLNVLDLISTRAVLAAGGQEGNPLMAQIIHDPIAPVLVKTAGVLIVALVVNACPPDSKIVNRALACSVLVYSAIVSWNLVNLLIAGA